MLALGVLNFVELNQWSLQTFFFCFLNPVMRQHHWHLKAFLCQTDFA